MFSVSFCPEKPFTLAIGAHDQLPAVVNILEWPSVRRALNLFAPGETPAENASAIAEVDAEPTASLDEEEAPNYSESKKKKKKAKKKAKGPL